MYLHEKYVQHLVPHYDSTSGCSCQCLRINFLSKAGGTSGRALIRKQCLCIYKGSKQLFPAMRKPLFLLVGKHPKPFEQTASLVWLRGNSAVVGPTPVIVFQI